MSIVTIQRHCRYCDQYRPFSKKSAPNLVYLILIIVFSIFTLPLFCIGGIFMVGICILHNFVNIFATWRCNTCGSARIAGEIEIGPKKDNNPQKAEKETTLAITLANEYCSFKKHVNKLLEEKRGLCISVLSTLVVVGLAGVAYLLTPHPTNNTKIKEEIKPLSKPLVSPISEESSSEELKKLAAEKAIVEDKLKRHVLGHTFEELIKRYGDCKRNSDGSIYKSYKLRPNTAQAEWVKGPICFVVSWPAPKGANGESSVVEYQNKNGLSEEQIQEIKNANGGNWNDAPPRWVSEKYKEATEDIPSKTIWRPNGDQMEMKYEFWGKGESILITSASQLSYDLDEIIKENRKNFLINKKKNAAPAL